MSDSAASSSEDRLLDAFEPATPDAWRAAAEKLLRGAPFEKRLLTPTPEGITLRPIYGAEDLGDVPHLDSFPGQAPFLRGSSASGYRTAGWEIEQEMLADSPEDWNRNARRALDAGQNVLHIVLDPQAQDRAPIDDGDQLGIALEGIDLAAVPVWIRAGASGARLTNDLITAAHRAGIPATALRGGVEIDPLGSLAEHGRLDRSLDDLWDEAATRLGHVREFAPHLGHVGIRGEVYGDGGADAVQELAFVLASLAETIREFGVREVGIDRLAPRLGVTLTLGSPLFTEIAKLRAMRLLWARVAQAFGGDQEVPTLRIRGRSTSWNRTAHDPHVNALRATTEAFAGVVGSVDGMQTGAFDALSEAPGALAHRLARNTQLVLRHEAHLTAVADPAGGSWYVEALTDELARSAWSLFQEIEGAGGMTRALLDGIPQARIAETVESRRRGIATARSAIVGVNRYADPSEPARSSRSSTPSNTSSTAAAVVTAPAVPKARASEPFEALRHRVDAHIDAGGARPPAALLGLGTIAETRARADFSRGFLEVGGFDVTDLGPIPDPADAARAAVESAAPIVVLCATDDGYVDRIPAFAAALGTEAQPTLLVAGRPGDRATADRTAGIDGYLHLGANLLEVLNGLLDRAGVPSASTAEGDR